MLWLIIEDKENPGCVNDVFELTYETMPAVARFMHNCIQPPLFII